MTAKEAIEFEVARLGDLLLAKNEKYGNAALEPLGVLAGHLSPEDGIRIRIDDKLKRLKTLPVGDDEDTIQDLAGYLVLLLAHRRLRAVAVSDEVIAKYTPASNTDRAQLAAWADHRSLSGVVAVKEILP